MTSGVEEASLGQFRFNC